MSELKELGEELNSLLDAYLNADALTRMDREHELTAALWDNKSGIVAALRAYAPSVQEPIFKATQLAAERLSRATARIEQPRTVIEDDRRYASELLADLANGGENLSRAERAARWFRKARVEHSLCASATPSECPHPWAHQDQNGVPFCAGCGEDWTNVLHPQPVEAFTPEDAWHDLVEKDDRNSPEEYPEMCLISFEELKDFMRRAKPTLPALDPADEVYYEGYEEGRRAASPPPPADTVREALDAAFKKHIRLVPNDQAAYGLIADNSDSDLAWKVKPESRVAFLDEAIAALSAPAPIEAGWQETVTIDRNELRRHVIANHVRLTSGGGMVPNGRSCKICMGEWADGATENHALTCPLDGSAPPRQDGNSGGSRS